MIKNILNNKTLIWQLIVLGLGISFLIIINNYFTNKITIEARSKHAECFINFQKNNLNSEAFCPSIENYFLK